VESDVKGTVNIYSGRENTTYLKLLFSLQLSSSQNEVMQKLVVADMTSEIESLEVRKDRLLDDSYQWNLETDDFKAFND
jgi:hypothetical protein